MEEAKESSDAEPDPTGQPADQPPSAADQASAKSASPAATALVAAAQASDSSTDADPNFRAWVNGLKINGVRGGAVPRVLIGGASYNQGDVVNAEMGVIFDSYDAQRHILRFRDRAGMVVERRDR